MGTTDPLINPCVGEIEVAKILVEFSQFVFRPLSCVTWGRKRRRSDIARYDALSLPESATATETAAGTEESPSPISVAGPTSEAAVLVVKAEASNWSPGAAVSLSPSESDEKEKPRIPRRKVSIKKRREELLKNVDELTRCKECLVLEINNAKLRYESLKQDNIRLKELVVRSGKAEAEPHLELETRNGVVNRQSQVDDVAIPTTAYERRMRRDGRAETAMVSRRSIGLGRVYDKVGPLDLNLSAEEAAAWELDGRARAAQARYKRKLKMKCRSINPNAACGHRIIS